MATGEGGKDQRIGAKDAGKVVFAGLEADLDAIDEEFFVRPDRLEITLPLSGGTAHTLYFKPYPRKSEFDAIIDHAREQYQDLPDPKAEQFANHPWQGIWPQSPQEFAECVLIHELSLEPKISMERALKWACNGPVFAHILNELERGSKTIKSVWEASLAEAQKKSLSTTSGEDSSSEPASTD